MGADSKIEWTDHSFNPWTGCTKVSPACDHCYAEGWAKRSGTVVWGGERRRTSESNWRQPLKWNAEAAREGRRFRVFCASLADVFDNQVPSKWRDDLWSLIEATPYLDWLMLTKRIGNAGNMLPVPFDFARLYPNVWIGATISSREEMLRDGPKLLDVGAAMTFWSVEPMLEDLGHIPDGMMPQWVICGGESGPHARPMSPDWARRLRDQCKAAGVPFLFKQWGEWIPMLGQAEGLCVRRKKATTLDGWVMGWAGKQAAGRHLDGELHDGFPSASPSPQVIQPA